MLLCTEFYAEGDAFIRFLRSIKVSASHADVSIPHGRYRQNAANAHLTCRLQVGIGTKRTGMSSETAEHHFTLCPVGTQRKTKWRLPVNTRKHPYYTDKRLLVEKVVVKKDGFLKFVFTNGMEVVI